MSFQTMAVRFISIYFKLTYECRPEFPGVHHIPISRQEHNTATTNNDSKCTTYSPSESRSKKGKEMLEEADC